MEKPDSRFDIIAGRRWEGSLQTDNVITKTKARWYILSVFSFYVSLQYFIWNSFGPIASSAKKAFDWDNGDIALLANWDTIIFVILYTQTCWLIQKKGIRLCFLSSLFLVALGSGLRCLSIGASYVIWSMNIGQILNGLGGMLAQAAGPVISNTWFPTDERTTATAFASLSCPLGVALSYIIGPLIVPDLDDTRSINITMHSNISYYDAQSPESIMKSKIFILMYLEVALATLVLLVACFHFPEKPPHPPSFSASLPRLEFKESYRTLGQNKDFLLILFIASSVTGVYSGWGAVLTVNFRDHGLDVTQSECGWIGFTSTIFSVIGGIVVGYFSDKYPGHIKSILICLYSVATIMFLWITFICLHVILFNIVSLYTACLIGGFCINGSIPLFYELVIELTYPVTEACSIGLLSLVNNIFTTVFLLLLNIPELGVSWMNWCLSISCGLTVILLTLFNETYARKNVDESYEWSSQVEVIANKNAKGNLDNKHIK